MSKVKENEAVAESASVQHARAACSVKMELKTVSKTRSEIEELIKKTPTHPVAIEYARALRNVLPAQKLVLAQHCIDALEQNRDIVEKSRVERDADGTERVVLSYGLGEVRG